MRLAHSLLIVVALVSAARAETELVVLGPAIDARIPADRATLVQGALAQNVVGPVATKRLDPTCATDAVCLGIIGTELKATRILAITVKPANAGVVIGFALVDVLGRELVATREVTVGDRRLAKELGAALRKFLDDAPIERAKALFTQGNQHYSLGEFVPALEFYRRAYRIKPLPAFLFNIAQCHRKLEQHREAITMYQSYLVGVPEAPNQALVDSLIAESKAKLADEQRIAEDAERARHETARLKDARRRAEAEHKAKEAEAVVAAERTKIEQARLADAAERAREKLYNTHPARTWTLVAGGVGVAAMIAGGGFAMRARYAQTAFDDAGCTDPDRLLDEVTLAQCVDDRDHGTRDAGLGTLLLASGGAVLATSMILFVIDPGNLERPAARAQLHLSPSSVQVVIRW